MANFIQNMQRQNAMRLAQQPQAQATSMAQQTQPVPGQMGQGMYGAPAMQGQPAPYPQQPQPGYQYGSGPNPGMVAPPTGLIGAEQALQGGLAGALSGLQSGQAEVNNQLSFGRRGLDPFMQRGEQSGALQAALSGAMGPQAQAQAYQNFQDSPGQAWLQERGERAVTRNASALGGLGGGRVMQELQRQGQGLAQQDFQNAYGRLNDMTGQGLQAAGYSGQLAGQGAGLMGNMGNTAAQLAAGTGQQLAGYRSQAGRDIAGNVAGNAQGLSSLTNQQGAGLSGLLGQTGGDLAALLQNAGLTQGMTQQQLAAMLSGQAMTSGGQFASMPGIPGIQEREGQMGNIGKLAGGIGSIMLASDERLKTNIEQVGVTPAGRNIYTWDWNAEGERLAVSGHPTLGVMAQENPDLAVIGPDGYLMVDYSRVD